MSLFFLPYFVPALQKSSVEVIKTILYVSLMEVFSAQFLFIYKHLFDSDKTQSIVPKSNQCCVRGLIAPVKFTLKIKIKVKFSSNSQPESLVRLK